jgi:hypothetical protein
MTHARRLTREIVLIAALAAIVFSPAFLLAQGSGQPGGPDIIGMLESTPGCLGVDAARTMSGKQVVFAWFESKQAVVNWVHSESHRSLMRAFAPGASAGRPPLADVPDNSGPILAVASITYSDAPKVEGVTLPVSQIAIELYAPLPGGLAAGGRFAPAAVKVPGLLEAPATAATSR